MTSGVEDEKRLAAEAAAGLIEGGMTVGLGTGSTVAYLLPALARRNLAIRCVATSPRTEEMARSLGIPIETFAGLDHLDIAIDGADQIAPDGWLVKGGGGAHTREKLSLLRRIALWSSPTRQSLSSASTRRFRSSCSPLGLVRPCAA